MPQPKGCLKSCALGCAGFAALLVIGGVIISTLAWKALNGGDDKRPLAENAVSTVVGAVNEPMSARAARLTTTQGGRVRLVLGEGEFRLRPAGPGEGLHARAEYDSTRHRLTELFTVLPDSTWEYHLDCRQVGSSSFLKQLFDGERNNAKVTGVPAGRVPIDLVLRDAAAAAKPTSAGCGCARATSVSTRAASNSSSAAPCANPWTVCACRPAWAASPRSRSATPRPRAGHRLRHGRRRLRPARRLARRLHGARHREHGRHQHQGAFRDAGRGHGALEPTLTGSTAEVPAPVLRLSATAKMGEVEVVR
ncbi:MAG: hypothetical protein IPH86_11200 [bacterium]|nr:hypothetical protein [bacterium]